MHVFAREYCHRFVAYKWWKSSDHWWCVFREEEQSAKAPCLEWRSVLQNLQWVVSTLVGVRLEESNGRFQARPESKGIAVFSVACCCCQMLLHRNLKLAYGITLAHADCITIPHRETLSLQCLRFGLPFMCNIGTLCTSRCPFRESTKQFLPALLRLSFPSLFSFSFPPLAVGAAYFRLRR